MHILRGLFFLAVLPFHTALLATAAIVVSVLLPRGGDMALGIGRLWSRILVSLGGVQLRTRGRVLAGGPWVLLSNHQSLFDIPALVLCLDLPFRMIAKRELFWIPFFGWALRAAGFVPVNRADREQAIASLSRAAGTLRRGCSLVVFAEGTRSPDGNLQTLKKGAFRLAQQAGVPMVPVTVSGSRAVLPRGACLPRGGVIDVVFGEPIPPPPPGGAVDENLLREAEASLRRGFTDRHRADLVACGRRPRTVEHPLREGE